MKGKILLVDDNVDYLDSTKDVLEDEGYDVITASSGEEALGLVQSRTFDVVLMDIKMPGKNGVETFIEMKQYLPHVRVIMCTAYIVESLIRRAFEEGAYAVLNKPFEMDLLLRTIDGAHRMCASGVILVADRDPKLCADVRRALSAHGHQVIVAHDGREAVVRGEKYAPDILLLELNLPVMGGLEVYSRIRERRPGTSAVIIIGTAQDMTGYAQQELKREAGVTGLTKPLNMSRLQELVDSICMARHQ